MSSDWSSGQWKRVLGPEMGDFVRALHEEHGVIFHLGDTVTAFDGKARELEEGGRAWIEADVVGRRRWRAAAASRWPKKAGLAIDRGVTVNAYLETSVPRHLCGRAISPVWPDPHSGESHSCRALGGGRTPGPDRRAQHAGTARSFLNAVPFFWSQHYDVPVNYVGHAEKMGRGSP